jgi:hypothetical protein
VQVSHQTYHSEIDHFYIQISKDYILVAFQILAIHYPHISKLISGMTDHRAVKTLKQGVAAILDAYAYKDAKIAKLQEELEKAEKRIQILQEDVISSFYKEPKLLTSVGTQTKN